MTAPASRRGLILGLAALPLAGGAAIAGPSDLARACDWGVSHLAWINNPAPDDRDWPDERLEADLDRVDDVLNRVADEASASLSDLAAKARIVLASDGQHLSMSHHDADRALLTLLREVVVLCA
ncbi:hypothetical protein MKK67_06710 [Methylobacterium sp. J-072]|uniref:hypothetical protein n=1 Tax=Methylobacterium sp. J-072 TaxID=2836651 RepID=UPI001FBA365B|nr:hypothetical protein [Methylobacterium sp. J-072]MCJ2092187.1 hypothetical protein [Methylobacterium sp. J-072]